MSGFDFSNPVTYPTEDLLKSLYNSHDVDHEEKSAVVTELIRRHADREQFHMQLQGANTKLVYENRALREFLGNRVPEWVADVVIETARAKGKHGDNAYTDMQRLAILMEEAGEVANVINRLYVPPISAMLNVPREQKNLRDELVQVVSVAVRWCERIDAESQKSEVGSQNAEQTPSPIPFPMNGEGGTEHPDADDLLVKIAFQRRLEAHHNDVDCGEEHCVLCKNRRTGQVKTPAAANESQTPLSPPVHGGKSEA